MGVESCSYRSASDNHYQNLAGDRSEAPRNLVRNHVGHNSGTTGFGVPQGLPKMGTNARFKNTIECWVRNEKSAQRGSVGPDIPADIRPKTSVRPSKSWKNKHFGDGHPARTSMKKLRSEKLRSEKLRADFSFPTQWSDRGKSLPRGKNNPTIASRQK